jgi:hypothetical protein
MTVDSATAASQTVLTLINASPNVSQNDRVSWPSITVLKTTVKNVGFLELECFEQYQLIMKPKLI